MRLHLQRRRHYYGSHTREEIVEISASYYAQVFWGGPSSPNVLTRTYTYTDPSLNYTDTDGIVYYACTATHHNWYEPPDTYDSVACVEPHTAPTIRLNMSDALAQFSHPVEYFTASIYIDPPDFLALAQIGCGLDHDRGFPYNWEATCGPYAIPDGMLVTSSKNCDIFDTWTNSLVVSSPSPWLQPATQSVADSRFAAFTRYIPTVTGIDGSIRHPSSTNNIWHPSDAVGWYFEATVQGQVGPLAAGGGFAPFSNPLHMIVNLTGYYHA